jgi:hypothetical protein
MTLGERRCVEALAELVRDSTWFYERSNSSESAEAKKALGLSLEAAEQALHELALTERERKTSHPMSWLIRDWAEVAP